MARSWRRIRRAAAARQAEVDTARRGLADAEAPARGGAAGWPPRSRRAGRSSKPRLEAARAAAPRGPGGRGAASPSSATRPASGRRAPRRPARWPRPASVKAEAAVSSVGAQLDALQARLAEEEARGSPGRHVALGGRRLDDDLVVDPAFRARGRGRAREATRAYVVGGRCRVRASPASAASWWSPSGPRRRRRPTMPASAGFRERLAAAGGGTLDTAVRRDAAGAARRLLGRAAWLPDLAGVPGHPAALPAGLGRRPARRRGGRDRPVGHAGCRRIRRWSAGPKSTGSNAAASAARGRGGATRARRRAGDAPRRRAAAARGRGGARRGEPGGRAPRAAAEEAERHGGAPARDRRPARRPGTRPRSSGWRLTWVGPARRWWPLAPAADGAPARGPEVQADRATAVPDGAALGRLGDPGGRAARTARPAGRRPRPSATRRAATPSTGGRAPRRPRRWRRSAWRARARSSAPLVERERHLAEERDAIRAELAAATAREAAARAGPGRGPRRPTRPIASASTPPSETAAAARERLRAADERLRAADHAELEARLGARCAARAGVSSSSPGSASSRSRTCRRPPGTIGVRPTPDRPTTRPTEDDPAVSDDVAALEAAVTESPRSGRAQPPSEPAPGPAASASSAAASTSSARSTRTPSTSTPPLKARLETLEAQAADLRTRHRPDAGPDRRARHADRRPVPDDLRGPRDRLRPASSSSSAAASPGCR